MKDDKCEKCGKRGKLKQVARQISRQTMSEPAEYETQMWCADCIYDEEQRPDPADFYFNPNCP